MIRSALSRSLGARVLSPRTFATKSPVVRGPYTYPESLLNVPETKVTTLANGLRVASEKSDLETATIGIWIDTGSRFETVKNNGVAHFLEHMAFKGTGKRTADSLELEIENLGAHLNAYTSRDQTVYYVKAFKNDLPQAVDILADILQNSSFDNANIERERGVILRERQEVEKVTEEAIFDVLHSAAFQGHPLGRNILGEISNIRSISRDDLVGYTKQNYAAPRMVLAAAGAVDHEALVGLASKAFGSLPATSSTPQLEPVDFTGSAVIQRDDTLDAAHIAIAFESSGWKSPDYFALWVANFIVGSWDRSQTGAHLQSSRLAQVFSEYSMARSFTSFNTNYEDTGLWGLYLVSDLKTNYDDVLFQVQREWVRLCMNVTEAEVARAREQLKASTLLSLDGSTAVCEDIGRQLITYGRRMTPYEICQRIDAVTPEVIQQVATKYFYDKDPVVVAVGPVESLPDYNLIRANTHWRRV